DSILLRRLSMADFSQQCMPPSSRPTICYINMTAEEYRSARRPQLERLSQMSLSGVSPIDLQSVRRQLQGAIIEQKGQTDCSSRAASFSRRLESPEIIDRDSGQNNQKADARSQRRHHDQVDEHHRRQNQIDDRRQRIPRRTKRPDGVRPSKAEDE